MRARSLLAVLCLISFGPGAAHAEVGFPDAFQARLAAADIAGAEALARARLVADPADAQAGFALGAAQFLGAVEGLGQDFWRHGLTQPDGRNALTGGDAPIGVTMLPFLRFPVPANPAPQPFSAEAFHDLLTRFDARLADSATTLAAVPRTSFGLRLDLDSVRLDLNADGVAQEDEKLATILARVAYLDEGTYLRPVTFDSGDLPWLEGYAHLLQGITDILLAHDLTQTVDQTFAAAFPDSPLPSAPLASAQKAQAELAAAMRDAGKCDYDRARGLRFNEDYSRRDPATLTPEERQYVRDYETCTSLSDSAAYGGIGDLVAFVHLMHWPVTDADRLKASRQHFLKMIGLSRESWTLILAETDNDHEWVPNPHQFGPFPNLRVTDQTVAGWMEFLDQAQGVLEGRLLIPHWRWDDAHGVNIARLFEEPRTFDPILLIAGVGAIPYIETGPLAAGSTLDTAMGLVDGGFLAYFLWFN